MPDMTDMQYVLDTVGKSIQAAAREGRFKHDLPGTITPTTNLMHGPGGIFGYPGISRDMFATRVKPRGLLAHLPALPSMDTNPIVAYLTGFTDDQTGSEKSAVCDYPLEAGDIKSCLQGALYGRYERATTELEINKLGERVNRGEFYDLRLVNDPLMDSDLGFGLNVPRSLSQVLNREVLARFMTLGVAFERLLGPLVYTGSPANNTGGGGYKESHGLETLVGTGKIDVITGNACAALDSFVRNFSYARVDSNTNLLLRHLTTMWRQVNDIADRTGLAPATFAFVMRRDLFHEIADLWPCAYSTYRCTVQNVADSTLARVMVDGMAQRQMADAIRNGQYLLIDGVQVPVILDDFIPEVSQTTSSSVQSGVFASDIYLLPLTVRGGILALFSEYFDFSGENGVFANISSLPNGGGISNDFWTDGGRFLWTTARTLWCVKWIAKLESRLRLLTPHLAARIDNVAYAPMQHLRSDDPSSSYFANGGNVSASLAPYTSVDFPAAS